MDTENPSTPAKFNSKKILIPAGVVIILAILFAVGFWYFANNPLQTDTSSKVEKVTKVASPSATVSASKDPTADWKTFTSEKFGYSVRYPMDWKTRICDGEEFIPISKYPTSTCEQGQYSPIAVYRRTYTVNEEIAFKDEDNKNGSFENYKKESIKVAGKEAIKISGKAVNAFEIEKGTIFQFIIVQDSETKPLIIEYYRPPNDTDYSNIFENILSTFKFL